MKNNKKQLSTDQAEALLKVLETRFEKHMINYGLWM